MSQHTEEMLDTWSFYWTEARLILAAITLFLGGLPPILALSQIMPTLDGLINTGLKLAWIVSGAVSIYLLYRWFKNQKKVFSQNNLRDKVAFFVAVITGLNLGFAGIAYINVGMLFASGRVTLILAGCLYVVVALYLQQQWKRNGNSMF